VSRRTTSEAIGEQISTGLDEAEVELPRLWADRRLRPSHRRSGDPGEDPDITHVPIAKEAAGCQFVVTEPFSAKVSHGQAAPKMEERRVGTDGDSSSVYFGTSKKPNSSTSI
jgi:hypothetical protein